MAFKVLFLAQKDRDEFNRIILSKPLARDLFISFARSGTIFRTFVISMDPSYSFSMLAGKMTWKF
jgi:hypothetical protein